MFQVYGPKRGIEPLDRDDCRYWLDEVAAMQPAKYHFVWEDDSSASSRHMGLIAEEVPDELRAAVPRTDTEAVDLYALTTALVASVKELKADADEQQATIQRLREEIELLRRE